MRPHHPRGVIGCALAAGLCAGLAIGCHAGEAAAPPGGTATRAAGPCLTPGPVTLAPSPIALAFVAPSEVRAGAPVAFAISATNTSDRPVLLSTGLPDQTFNFLVRRADSTTVWNRLTARHIDLIEDVAVYQTLALGQQVRFEAVWDQRDQGGVGVPAGEYSVFGVFYTDLASDQPGHCYRSEPHRLVVTR